MENIGMEGDFNRGRSQDYRDQAGYRQGGNNMRNSEVHSRPGVPHALTQSGYSNGFMSEVTSTAGYTLSGTNDPQQQQNLNMATKELSEGRLLVVQLKLKMCALSNFIFFRNCSRTRCNFN